MRRRSASGTTVQVWPFQVKRLGVWRAAVSVRPPTAVHDVALKQLTPMRKPPATVSGSVAIVQADPFQVMIRLVAARYSRGGAEARSRARHRRQVVRCSRTSADVRRRPRGPFHCCATGIVRVEPSATCPPPCTTWEWCRRRPRRATREPAGIGEGRRCPGRAVPLLDVWPACLGAPAGHAEGHARAGHAPEVAVGRLGGRPGRRSTTSVPLLDERGVGRRR